MHLYTESVVEAQKQLLDLLERHADRFVEELDKKDELTDQELFSELAKLRDHLANTERKVMRSAQCQRRREKLGMNTSVIAEDEDISGGKMKAKEETKDVDTGPCHAVQNRMDGGCEVQAVIDGMAASTIAQPSVAVNSSQGSRRRKRRKARLPVTAVSILQRWFLDHRDAPYPRSTDKLWLAEETGLTQKEVSKWFHNVRHRTWKSLQKAHLDRKECANAAADSSIPTIHVEPCKTPLHTSESQF
mmetsp:Transcript_62688/g.111777  ORF Transcript_62688/g.111777 Transcript_62688/m.111777 type:complete len:246 (-) Transcript_62688:1321-2058(-)